jgi:hypothetical protein
MTMSEHTERADRIHIVPNTTGEALLVVYLEGDVFEHHGSLPIFGWRVTESWSTDHWFTSAIVPLICGVESDMLEGEQYFVSGDRFRREWAIFATLADVEGDLRARKAKLIEDLKGSETRAERLKTLGQWTEDNQVYLDRKRNEVKSAMGSFS